VAKTWNIEAAGNFHDEASGKMTGNNIPHLSNLLSKEDTVKIMVPRQKLFDHRENRIHPLKDTKVLTDWNGLMIAAYAKAGRAFGMSEYTEQARKANAFIESEMREKNGTLLHRYREGHKAIGGHMEDYAFMIFGLLELYESTLDPHYLESALQYNEILRLSFIDKEGGGYYMTAEDAEPLIIRPKELYDGAIPSGNSIQMLNLLKLARLTGRSDLEQQSIDVGKAFSGSIERSPSNYAQTLIALQFAQQETIEIVVVGEREDKTTQAMLDYINRIYKPGKVVLLKSDDTADTLTEIAPFTKEQGKIGGKTTVYICRNFACEQPINTLEELKNKLK
jgi:uncharacterized protein YyaL (SSP411 family)